MFSSDAVSKETRAKLRSYRKKTSSVNNLPQDNVYILETILDCEMRKKQDGEIRYFKIKWVGFPLAEASWEPEDTIPKFIRDFYEDKSHFGKNLPNPVVKNSKQVGGTKYHLLSWQKESESKSGFPRMFLISIKDYKVQDKSTQ